MRTGNPLGNSNDAWSVSANGNFISLLGNACALLVVHPLFPGISRMVAFFPYQLEFMPTQ